MSKWFHSWLLLRLFWVQRGWHYGWPSHLMLYIAIRLFSNLVGITLVISRKKSMKVMAPHSSTLAWKIPWTKEPGRLQSMGSRRARHNWATFTFHFHALEKAMATHSSVLAWRTPGTGEPGGLLSMGSHRVGHDWSDLAAGILKRDNLT